MDSSIKNERPNDIPLLLDKYPNIRLIILNGSKAEKLFKKYYKNLYSSFNILRLSSTSNTPGKHVKPLDEKVVEWRSSIKNVL